MDSRQPLTTMLAGFGIERHDEAVAADGVAKGSEQVVVDSAGLEGGSADDDLAGALFDESLRALDRAHAAADARGGARGQHADQRIVGAAAHGGVEIDHLNFGEGGEAAQHLFGGIAFQGLFAALDQLHHLAVHQVDTGEDHDVTRTGMPCLSSSSLSWFTV